MIKKLNTNNLRKITAAVIFNLSILLTCYILCVVIPNNSNFKEWYLVKDITGINLVIGLISIFSFFLYSYLHNDDYFYMFSLMYISIYFEFVFSTFFAHKFNLLDLVEINKTSLELSSIFRTIIMWLAYYEHNFINKYLIKNKIYSIFLSIFITLFCILSDIYLLNSNILNSYTIIINFIKFISNLFAYIVLIKFFILYFTNKSMHYILIFIGTYIIILARILLVDSLYIDKTVMYLTNRVLLALGFFTIIISMFLEIIVKTNENRNLVKEYNTQKNEIDRLKQEDEIRTQFFANISHELRTPLNILICSFQLLKSQSDNKEDLFNYYKKYENTINTNSSRMLRLINNIIDASKFDSGFEKMNFVNCDIISLVEEVTLSIAQSQKAQDRTVIFDTNAEYLEIKCDPDNIERAMLNLLSNAVKFTKSDGNIIVTCEEVFGYLIIRVKDDGIGIPPEFRSRIFDRFVQVDKSFRRNTEGSGIGLSLVKFIVDSHGGTIHINDKVEKGCEFVIKLPKVLINSQDDTQKNYNKSMNKELDAKVVLELSDID